MVKARCAVRFTAGPAGAEIARELLAWFALHQRDLPWRRSRDPYRIWVSEVMLQQTRVDTVIPYYQRWFEQFPTLQSLAEAPDDQVLKAWEGLGYYSRARNLHAAVREVVAQYGGQVPADPEAVAALKGVGSYTAGAILSIAFGTPVPAVDGNVLRVLARLFLIREDVARPATRKAMSALAEDLIPLGQACDFNQALMELGALICTPAAPKCLACPVGSWCRAREEGEQGALPVKARSKAPRPVAMVAAVIRCGGRVLIVRRPPQGLLAGLWEFPSGHRPEGLDWEPGVHAVIRERFGVEVELEAHLATVRHVFSHLVWDLRAYTAAAVRGAVLPGDSEDVRWVELSNLNAFAFPVAFQKVIRALVSGTGKR